MEEMKAAAKTTAESYRSSRLAIYEEILYNQCICEKMAGQRRDAWIYRQEQDRKGERAYGAEEERTEHDAEEFVGISLSDSSCISG